MKFSTPATRLEKPHCGIDLVPFMKSTTSLLGDRVADLVFGGHRGHACVLGVGRVGGQSRGLGGQGQGVQFAVRAVHLALQRGVDGALLLDAVLAAEAFVDHLGREMGAVVALDA